jgi:phosphate transport system permease protein
MTEPALPPQVSTWNSPEMAKRLQGRYAAERRFKAIGAGAVALSLSFLAFLLFIMLRPTRTPQASGARSRDRC